MADPLAEIVTLLRPRMKFSKIASGAGPWRLRKEGMGIYSMARWSRAVAGCKWTGGSH